MAQDTIRAELQRVAATLGAPAGVAVELETPRDKTHGDVATNLALTLAKPLRQSPRQIACGGARTPEPVALTSEAPNRATRAVPRKEAEEKRPRG